MKIKFNHNFVICDYIDIDDQNKTISTLINLELLNNPNIMLIEDIYKKVLKRDKKKYDNNSINFDPYNIFNTVIKKKYHINKELLKKNFNSTNRDSNIKFLKN